MNKPLRALEKLESRAMFAGLQATLLADFSEGGASSEFSDFEPIGDKLVFDVNESEFWITDGGPDGTQKLADVDHVRPLFHLGEYWLFNVRTGDSWEVWRTDGTSDGTFQLLADQSIPSETRFVTDRAGTSYFLLPAADQMHLYQTDGIPEGTQLLRSLPEHSVITSEASYYLAEADDGESALIRINHETTAFPEPVATLPQPTKHLAAIKDRLVFVATNELTHLESPEHRLADSIWISDGTQEGTQAATEPLVFRGRGRSIEPSPQINLANSLFFTGEDLFRFHSDGTIDGTRRFADPQVTFGALGFDFVGTNHGRAYFELISDSLFMLLSTDGLETKVDFSSNGAGDAWQTRNGIVVSVRQMENDCNSMWVIRDRETRRLGPQPIRPEVPEIQIGFVGETTYFVGERVDHLWTNCFVYEFDVESENDHIILKTTSDDKPEEIPFFDGHLLDGNTTRSHGDNLVKSDDAPLFVKKDGKLFALDGGRELNFIGDFFPRRYQYSQDGFYFVSKTEEFGNEVWRSDGQSTQVLDLAEGSASSDPTLMNWNGQALMIAETPDHGRELYAVTHLAVEQVLGDANGDTLVDQKDFEILAANFGRSNANGSKVDESNGDFNDDGKVDFVDFLILADRFNHSPG